MCCPPPPCAVDAAALVAVRAPPDLPVVAVAVSLPRQQKFQRHQPAAQWAALMAASPAAWASLARRFFRRAPFLGGMFVSLPLFADDALV